MVDWRIGDADPLDDPKQYDPPVQFCEKCGRACPEGTIFGRCNDCTERERLENSHDRRLRRTSLV